MLILFARADWNGRKESVVQQALFTFIACQPALHFDISCLWDIIKWRTWTASKGCVGNARRWRRRRRVGFCTNGTVWISRHVSSLARVVLMKGLNYQHHMVIFETGHTVLLTSRWFGVVPIPWGLGKQRIPHFLDQDGGEDDAVLFYSFSYIISHQDASCWSLIFDD